MFSVNSSAKFNRKPSNKDCERREGEPTFAISVNFTCFTQKNAKTLYICVRSILTQYTTKANANARHNIGV